MKLIFKALIFSAVLFLSACHFDGCINIASDQLKPADSIIHQGKSYFLYTRTSGWHEKVVYFELYEREPTYDSCTHETNPEPIFSLSYDDLSDNPDSEEQYIEKILLQPNQAEKLKMIYTKDVSKGVEGVYEVRFAK